MPRQSRKLSGTGIHHVMLRGVNRQTIFEEDEDYRRFLSIIRSMVERSDDMGNHLPPLCTFFAYCLMDNHVHLLIMERQESIGETVKRIGVHYAYYFNTKYGRNGHLFQDRFRSEPVNDMAYFVTLLRYIHQNPVKAGLVGHVAEYPWSSWQEYANESRALSSICAGNQGDRFLIAWKSITCPPNL